MALTNRNRSMKANYGKQRPGEKRRSKEKGKRQKSVVLEGRVCAVRNREGGRGRGTEALRASAKPDAESAQAKPEGRKKGFICSQLFIAFRCSGGVGARPIRSQYPRVPVRAIRIHYRAEPRPLSFHRCKSHFIPSLTVSFYLFVGETYRYRTRGQLARSPTRTRARECMRTDESASTLVYVDTRAKSQRHVFYSVCARM